jgi:hypothetical protein
MTALELVSLLTSSGVCAGGFGVLKWAIGIEKRLIRVELRNGIKA